MKTSKSSLFAIVLVSAFVLVGLVSQVSAQEAEVEEETYKFHCPGLKGKYTGIVEDGRTSIFFHPSPDTKLGKKFDQIRLSKLCTIKHVRNDAPEEPPVVVTDDQ